MKSQSAYSIEQLTFSYRNGRRVPVGPGDTWVLNEVTFEVPAGESLGVIGPNGSGKTSLLKLLARVLRPQAGRIELFGGRLAEMPQDAVARTVAFVPQDSQQLFPFTIAETVLMGRYPHHRSFLGFGWEGPEDFRLAEQSMQELDIAHLAHRALSEVSGGERQRAIIARALTQ
ncbi:MAG: ABC transporter ATP-binding protein, partial [Nitrospiraceae bacterium]